MSARRSAILSDSRGSEIAGVKTSVNHLRHETVERLFAAFTSGKGVRGAAREVGCNRETAAKYRRAWIKAKLQEAYDLLWEGDGDGCDAITALLPEAEVKAMLDAWLDDQFGQLPRSR